MWLRLVLCMALPVMVTAFGFPSLADLTDFWSRLAEKRDDSRKLHRVKRSGGDQSPLAWEVKTQTLPLIKTNNGNRINFRYMPTLGNGHIATTVYDDFLYMNGLYSGVGSDSHRAKIPAIFAFRIGLERHLEDLAVRTYTLNAEQGLFTETIDCELGKIEHTLYIHQKYIRLFVSDIYIRPNAMHSRGKLMLQYRGLNTSTDIRFGNERIYERVHKGTISMLHRCANSSYSYTSLCERFEDIQDLTSKTLPVFNEVTGQTLLHEEGSTTQTVHVFYHDPVKELLIYDKNPKNITFVMAVDRTESSAKSEFNLANSYIRDSRTYILRQEHIKAWKAVWQTAKIEVEGNVQLDKIVRFSQYYILSSLPAINPQTKPQRSELFFGLGRQSLAKNDYNGHVFWDNEMYLLPVLVLLFPELAKWQLRYRAAMAGPALEHARAIGLSGYRFPWESAHSGRDVTPLTCKTCRDQQLFVTAAVGYAIRLYYSATKDKSFLQDDLYKGCKVMEEIARFWANKAVYNSTKGRYDINNVMGPDDFHPNVNNNVFTNVMASLSIHYARYLVCECSGDFSSVIPDEWIQKAMYLYLPFDPVKRLHYAYEGYEHEKNNTIKQMDTVLLGFPIGWNYSDDIMRNDVEFYRPLTIANTPAMTHSFQSAVYNMLGLDSEANAEFIKGYQDYVVQPFKIWTEYNEKSIADQRAGTVNFLPGMGGFLMTLMYGFAGIKIRPEMLEFRRPSPPPDASGIKITGLKYVGYILDITIRTDEVTIYVRMDGQFPLVLKKNETTSEEIRLTAGSTETIKNPKQGFFIYSVRGTSCEHPRDYIYMPWGYSPWIDAAPSLSATYWTVLILLLTSLHYV